MLRLFVFVVFLISSIFAKAADLAELDSLLLTKDYQSIIKAGYKEKGNNEVISWLKSKAENDVHPPIQYLLSLILSQQIASSVKYKFSPESTRDTLLKEELAELAKYYAQGKTAFQIEVAECASLQSPSLNNWLRDNQTLKMPAESLLFRTPVARSIAIQAAKDSTDWIAIFVGSEAEQPPVWLCGEGNVRSDSTRFSERLKAYNNAKEQVSNLR